MSCPQNKVISSNLPKGALVPCSPLILLIYFLHFIVSLGQEIRRFCLLFARGDILQLEAGCCRNLGMQEKWYFEFLCRQLQQHPSKF